MMDDGLHPHIIHPFKWHRQFVPTVSRIVRVEAVAAELLEHLAIAAGFLKVGLDADWNINQTESFLVRFNTVFRNQIRTLANDPDVRGFKSVICYRTGLDVTLDSKKNIRPHQSLTGSVLLTSFHEFMQNAVRHSDYRIAQKEVNDYLVVAVCDVLDKIVDTDGENLPFQFHTGLGDTDINLVKSNPAYMQPLIEAFPNVDFVILHSSYPFTREAGYLAANYVNAWLDIGEVFPMLSRDGEESVLRQALELTPSSKILWSTDGHFYPETYYLANRQLRDTLEKVLSAYVVAGDLTIAQAVHVAVDILFWNSNTLYRLDEERKYPELLRACGRIVTGSLRTLANGTSNKPSSYKSNASTMVDSNGQASGRPGASARPPPSQTPSQNVLVNRTAEPSTGQDGAIANTIDQKVAVFDAFLQANPSVKYIWIQFIDNTNTTRNRMTTIAQFRKQLSTGKCPYTTKAIIHILQDDTPSARFSATGQFLMDPDLSTLCLNKGIPSRSATVQTWWMEDTLDVPATEHWNHCPRWLLQQQVDRLQTEFNINIIMGFEIEIVFMRPIYNSNNSDFIDFESLNMVHSWSNMTYQQLDHLPMIEEIVETLSSIDIHLPQFHAESSPGQWEFPLPCATPVKAVDMLYKARSVISNIAKTHGLKATCYPRPYNFSAGSANHAHLSLNPATDNPLPSSHGPSFLAGIMEHLPAIVAFTLPLEESYARIAPNIWAGGEYVAWGTENKEVPLRAITSPAATPHWEFKSLDGMANMYFASSSILASGLYGLRQKLDLEQKDCLGDPTGIGEEEREKLGIKTKLPHSLEESLWCLKRDSVLKDMLGRDVVDDYIAIKEAEMAKLRGMGDVKRRVWLISRY